MFLIKVVEELIELGS